MEGKNEKDTEDNPRIGGYWESYGATCCIGVIRLGGIEAKSAVHDELHYTRITVAPAAI